ncbi:hypothetical protein [Tomitella biformata]|uniref:hypothetical protein n=1 Tax=Tomitella biformata TaxID=630403 RepID=UPI000466026F|nr:hypothetical protein [Tomitella biformata]
MAAEKAVGIEVGTTLSVAMVSPVASGLIRTWTDSESRLWSVDDPAALGELIGRGVIARTAVSDNLFREVALLDAEAGTLVVQERFATADDAGHKGRVFHLGAPAAPQNNPWDDLQDFIAAAALAAAQRGEFLSVESGGGDASPTPAFFFTLIEEDGQVVSVIEASPPPRGTEVWPEVPVDQDSCSLHAPLAEDTLTVVGIFASAALDSWGLDPWAVAATFGRADDAK